jgi:hypothetical protein
MVQFSVPDARRGNCSRDLLGLFAIVKLPFYQGADDSRPNGRSNQDGQKSTRERAASVGERPELSRLLPRKSPSERRSRGWLPDWSFPAIHDYTSSCIFATDYAIVPIVSTVVHKSDKSRNSAQFVKKSPLRRTPPTKRRRERRRWHGRAREHRRTTVGGRESG